MAEESTTIKEDGLDGYLDVLYENEKKITDGIKNFTLKWSNNER